MFSTIATIPLQGEYLQESLALVWDANDTLLLGWLENRSTGQTLMIATLSADHDLAVRELGFSTNGFAITPLAAGSFGLVRTRGRLLEACVLDNNGALSPFRPIMHRQGDGVAALSLAQGALGVSATQMLVAYLPEANRVYIADVTPESWGAAATALANGEIVRVTAGPHDHTTNPPRYYIRGRRFTSELTPNGDFSLLLPSKIIGNMLANPQQLAVVPLAASGFVVAWTLLPHHLGSEIQFQCFNQAGEPQGSIVTVASSNASAHIARVSLCEGAPERMLFAWTRQHEQLSQTELVCHSLWAGTTTVLRQTGWCPLTGGLAVAANARGRFWIVEVDAGRLVVSQWDHG